MWSPCFEVKKLMHFCPGHFQELWSPWFKVKNSMDFCLEVWKRSTNTKHTHSIPSYWKVPFWVPILGSHWDSCVILYVSFCLKMSSLDPNCVSFRLFILKVVVNCMLSVWLTTIVWELCFKKLFTPLLRVEALTFWIAWKCIFCRSEQDETMWASA